ncbi:isochorismatase family protein [Lactobacillus sp. ESL0701]|uniref:isochorismatase family protein n=1 Tax=Lactobacillus sp. ESL0701 TaxID=2983217 RepID=UPI0023F80788|nr:isochorismatase family protein [Lactobacillus sp. ESL0701]MDF7672980.1 isochorismatase family protein [Lactobacillus sp. ESL0701]
MQNYLIVIDMQTDYIGKEKKFADPKLISEINKRIALYPADHVIYIVNRFLWESSYHVKKLAENLDVVSSLIFEKRHSSCLTNKNLQTFLEDKNAYNLEFVGVDGNYCVNASIIASIKNGYSVSVKLNCIGAKKAKKFERTIQKWQKMRCQIISD